MKKIRDRLIDLTQDSKFGAPLRLFPWDLEGGQTFSERIPWLKRRNRIETDTDLKRIGRKYGDKLSDDFGCTVRRTSNGAWWFAGDLTKTFKYPREVLNDYLYEEMGGELGQPLKWCYRCGKVFFSRGNLECLDCKLGTHSEVSKKFNNKIRYVLTDNIRNGFGYDRRRHL